MGRFAPLMLPLMACGPDAGRDEPRNRPPTTVVDTANPSPPTELPTDTGTLGPTPTDSGAATTRLSTSGVILCADPTARATLGPMIRSELPSDFTDQGSNWRSAGVVLEDLTGDGRYDLFLAEPARSTLWVGDGTGHFVDETAARMPAPQAPHAGYGGSAADAEGDGDLDVYMASNGGQDILFLNDGRGRFVEGAVGLPVETWLGATGAAWGDMDGDGDLDVIVSNFKDDGDLEEPMSGDPSVLLENLGDGTFADVSDRLDRLTRGGFTYVASWVDHDLDGDLDLYFVNDTGPQHVPNRMLSNAGDGTFLDVSRDTGTGVAIYGMGLGIGDLNGDRYPDFAMSTVGPPVLLESHLGTVWIETAKSRPVEEPGGRSIGWGTDLLDLDNDGDLDMSMLIAPLSTVEGEGQPEPGPDEVWLQEEAGAFVRVADAWGMADRGWARGAAFADIDDNGWLDMVKRDRDGPTVVYMARCGAESWLRVKLRATGPNPFGVGARIEVEGGGRRWVEWIRAGGSNLASSAPLEVHFGLGGLEAVDALRVIWPDGTAWELGSVTARQVVTVSRD